VFVTTCITPSPQSDIAMFMDHCGKDEEGNLLTDTPDYMSDSNRELSPARRQSPTLTDVHSSNPSTFFPPPPQPLLPDLVFRYRRPLLSIVRLYHVNQQ
jgi:hypothetical protein